MGIEEETLTLNMPDTNRAEAILTLDSLPDDAVGAVRYRLEFDLQEDGVTWELVWAGRQQQCRRDPPLRMNGQPSYALKRQHHLNPQLPNDQ